MKSLSYLNKYFIKYKWHLLCGILFIAISNYFTSKMPGLIGNASNKLSDNGLEINTVFGIVLKIILMYILFSFIKGVFLFLTRQMIIIMSRRIEFDLKNEIFNKYQQLDYRFYKGQSTGDLMNRISEDVSQVRQYLGPGIMYTLNLIISLPFFIYQMCSINVELTLWSLAPLPVMTVLIYFVSSKMNRLSKEAQEQQSKLSTIAQESFSGIRVIKAYLQETHVQNNFADGTKEYHKRIMKQVKMNALFMPTISFLIGVSTMFAIYLWGTMVMGAGKKDINNGDILTIVNSIYMLTWPFASVGWVSSIIQRASASQTRINAFLEVQPEIMNNPTVDSTVLEKISMHNVHFKYKPELPLVLKNINFDLPKGSTLGIVGRTGSGKTTLTQLLVRQLDPSSGEVKFNENNLKNIDLDSFRNDLAVVPQDVFLFSDSIENNILFGLTNQKIEDTDLKIAAEDAHVLHNIEDFPDKFNTILGERGVNLSGGQKQRISIARALIRKPRLLILDDCLSAVDTETEDVILRNLNKYAKKYNTTTVIVSHRVSSLRNADQIILLESGEIKEQGTHEFLMRLKGNYFKMYEKQLLEEKKIEQ